MKETFRDFIDRNTNLLTVVGIFNALALYSNSIQPKFLSEYLGLLFILISVGISIAVAKPELTEIKNFNFKTQLFKFSLLLSQTILIVHLLLAYNKATWIYILFVIIGLTLFSYVTYL